MENLVVCLYRGLDGRDWVAHHWDAFVAIHAEDVVVEARTAAATRYVVRGRDAAVDEARSLSDVGLPHVTMEPLAIRADRLALIRWLNWAEQTPEGGGPSEVEQFAVVEANPDGLVAAVVIFDDRVLAEAELERRADTLARP